MRWDVREGGKLQTGNGKWEMGNRKWGWAFLPATLVLGWTGLLLGTGFFGWDMDVYVGWWQLSTELVGLSCLTLHDTGDSLKKKRSPSLWVKWVWGVIEMWYIKFGRTIPYPTALTEMSLDLCNSTSWRDWRKSKRHFPGLGRPRIVLHCSLEIYIFASMRIQFLLPSF